MAYTQTQLINAVYAEVAVSQDAPSSDDVATITSRLADIVADLAGRRITGTITLSAIADALFADLVKVVAERIAPFYGRPTNTDALKAAEARLGQSYRLDRTLWTAFERSVLEFLGAQGADPNAIDGTAVTGVVQQVLDDLSSKRIVTIANEAAISSQQTPHIVTLVAARLLPKAVPADAVARAVDALAVIARLVRAGSTALTRAILEQLEVWGAGSAALDATAVSARIPNFLDLLAARQIIYFPDEDSITSAAYQAVVRFMAGWLAAKPIPDVIAQAERELRLISAEGPTGEVLVADYF